MSVKKILLDIASSLQAHESEIMAANAIDMEQAEKRYKKLLRFIIYANVIVCLLLLFL